MSQPNATPPAPPSPACIDPTLTVNEIVARAPATIGVFDAWRIDSCCGGARTLDEVARRHGLVLEALLADLNASLDAG